MNKFLNRDKDRTPDLFLYALTFLHTIGSIEKKGYKIKLVKKENQEENIIAYLDYIALLFIDELIKEEKKYNRDYSKLKKQIFLITYDVHLYSW